ncbi:MAG: acetyl-CoA C-acetyltransferase [Pseudomonadales bacterium]|nr:acetyl-CoA C-acetyltransferase [Pseudomonadales bacterium]
MNSAFVYDHVRTPRGKGREDGALHNITPVHLAAQTLSSLRTLTQLDPAMIGDVGLGIVTPVGEQGCDLTRFALLEAGYGDEAVGYQLNRFCTSGLDTVKFAAGMVSSGQTEAAIGGGVEMMSRVTMGSDGGAAYSDPELRKRYPYIPNGVAADLMATLNGITREEVDAYAVESQARATRARDEGRFYKSILPVEDVDGNVVLDQDEAIRPDTTIEKLANLTPAFEKLGADGYNGILKDVYPDIDAIDHIHTGGNSSGIVDGACAVLVGSENFGKMTELRPRAKIRAATSIASDPHLSLGGVIPVTEKALMQASMTVDDIDLFEVNEAFAVVPLVYARHFNIERGRINANGGSIALGHPLGATGAILLGTLIDELERQDLSIGLVTLCAAAGQSTALIIERV